jgi:hypothetical protein
MRFRFTLVVWGDWHIGQFVRHGLPSLRAPGNLDAIDHVVSAKTRPSDLERVRAALDGVNAEIEALLPDDIGSDQATCNTAVFTHNVDDRSAAAQAGEAWGLLSPDMVWGEGTWAHHRAALEGGAKAVFRPLLRVDSERAGTIRDFRRRSLAATALEHEHAIARTDYRAGGERFSPHAEMIIWEAPGWLINRTITAEVQTCIPAAVPFNSQGLSALPLDGEMCVVRDSDEAIAVAMCPPDKDFGWLQGTRPLDVDLVRGFLRSYNSPASRNIARQSYHLHAGDIVDAEIWKTVLDRRSDDFITEVFA